MSSGSNSPVTSRPRLTTLVRWRFGRSVNLTWAPLFAPCGVARKVTEHSVKGVSAAGPSVPAAHLALPKSLSQVESKRYSRREPEVMDSTWRLAGSNSKYACAVSTGRPMSALIETRTSNCCPSCTIFTSVSRETPTVGRAPGVGVGADKCVGDGLGNGTAVDSGFGGGVKVGMGVVGFVGGGVGVNGG